MTRRPSLPALLAGTVVLAALMWLLCAWRNV